MGRGHFSGRDFLLRGAASEGLDERHVRRLAPLGYLSPRALQAIADRTTSSGLTVSSLTLALRRDWAAKNGWPGSASSRPRVGRIAPNFVAVPLLPRVGQLCRD